MHVYWAVPRGFSSFENRIQNIFWTVDIPWCHLRHEYGYFGLEYLVKTPHPRSGCSALMFLFFWGGGQFWLFGDLPNSPFWRPRRYFFLTYVWYIHPVCRGQWDDVEKQSQSSHCKGAKSNRTCASHLGRCVLVRRKGNWKVVFENHENVLRITRPCLCSQAPQRHVMCLDFSGIRYTQKRHQSTPPLSFASIYVDLYTGLWSRSASGDTCLMLRKQVIELCKWSSYEKQTLKRVSKESIFPAIRPRNKNFIFLISFKQVNWTYTPEGVDSDIFPQFWTYLSRHAISYGRGKQWNVLCTWVLYFWDNCESQQIHTFVWFIERYLSVRSLVKSIGSDRMVW